MADTNTTRYGLVKPEVGASADSWGSKLNTDFDDLDAITGAITTTGSANAYVLTTSLSLAAYVAGQSFDIKASFGNTGAATINVDTLGAKSLTKNGTTALASGDIVSGNIYRISYDGTQFQIIGGYLSGIFQPIDSDLTAIAALTSAANKFPYSTGAGTWAMGDMPTAMLTFLTTPSSANLAALTSDEAGSGALYFTGGALGTPASGTLTNATGLPISTGVSGLGTGVATFLATPSSANLAIAVTDETGSGALVFGTSPTLGGTIGGSPSASGAWTFYARLTSSVTGDIAAVFASTLNGNPESSGTTFTATGIRILQTGSVGVDAGVYASGIMWLQPRNTANFATNYGLNLLPNGGTLQAGGSDVLLSGGALGTPTSGTLTNCTGLPVSTGISGLGTGVATFLATPSSANFAAAITDETGSSKVVFSAGTLDVTSGKTLTASNTLTLTATDGSTLAIGGGGTLATAAYKATGTSGNTVPLLDGTNTASAAWTFSATANSFTTGSGNNQLTIGAPTSSAVWFQFQASGGNRFAVGRGPADLTDNFQIYDNGSSSVGLEVIYNNGDTRIKAAPTTLATNSAGFRGCPAVGTPNSAYTMVLGDAGGQLYHDEVTARTWTIPANSSVAYPIGTTIVLDNTGNSGSAGTITLSITTDTLRRGDGTSGTGSRTIAANQVAVIRKVASTVWTITGTFS